MFPADREPTPVTVELTASGQRSRRNFPDAISARRFYARMFLAGADPKVRATNSPEVQECSTMATKTTATTTKTTKPAETNGAGEFGIERSHDLPWGAKKVAIFQALRRLGATSATKAATASDVATAAKLTYKDRPDTQSVRHYCYHARVSGLVELTQPEGSRGYSFYLTKAGAKIDPAKELAKQEAARAKE